MTDLFFRPLWFGVDYGYPYRPPLINQYFSLFTHADLQLSSLSVENTRLTGTQIRVYLLAAGRAQIKVTIYLCLPRAEITTL